MFIGTDPNDGLKTFGFAVIPQKSRTNIEGDLDEDRGSAYTTSVSLFVSCATLVASAFWESRLKYRLHQCLF